MGALCVGASCVRYGGSVEQWGKGAETGGVFGMSTLAIKEGANGKRDRKKF